MSEAIPGLIITATFLLLSSLTFLFLTEMWSDQSRLIQASIAQQVEHTNTSIAIQSDNLGMDLGCNTLTAPVDNTGQTSVARFSEMDLLADYTDTSSAKVVNHLEYTTDWTLGSLNPDTRDPNQWNPVETATFKVPISPLIQFDSSGTLVVVTPGGVIDSSYFSCPTTHYFHSETSSINSVDYYQLKAASPDGTAGTLSVSIASEQVARLRPSPNDGKFVIPLTDTDQIRASTWDVTYRLRRDKADFGFVWFENARDISLSTMDSWQDIDLTAHVPVGATGAVVEVVNTGLDWTQGGVLRGKEDSRDYMSNPHYGPVQVGAENHRWQMVKIDSNRLIQGYITSPAIDFKLIGYTIGTDPSFFPSPADVTIGTTGSWAAVDLSSQVDSDADGAILFLTGDAKRYGIREVGSSYSTTSLTTPVKGNTMYLVGLDGNKEFETYLEGATNIYLVGQTKGSVVYYTNDLVATDPVTGVWASLDADTFGVDTTANGLLLHAEVANESDIGFRHADSTDNWNKKLPAGSHVQAAVGINSSNLWDEYMEDLGTDISIAGYTRLVRLDVHADLDLLIRQADGTVRATLYTDSADTGNIISTEWQTYTATLPFSAYTTVDNTDYLEIDFFIESTLNDSQESVSVEFRIDDPGLDQADQMAVLP